MNPTNLLPCDGEAYYYTDFLGNNAAGHHFDMLLQNIEWQNDIVKMFGKTITTSRKTAWYGKEPFEYTYSKISRRARPFTEALYEIEGAIAEFSGVHFNSCLLNLYHHGGEGMGWHADDEKSIDPHSAIASLSLGAERKFAFKHKQTGERVDHILASGSMLLMKAPTQVHWHHSLPKTKKINAPRINLTFRNMLPQNGLHNHAKNAT